MPTHLKRSRISIEWIVIQKKTIRRLIFGILGIPLIAFILFIVVRNYLINSEFTPTQPSSSAYFLEIKGNVTVKRATTNAIEVATKNTTISPGDTIHTNPEAVARIKYPDGTEFSIRSGATIIFKGDSGANIDRKIENRLENGTVTVTTQQNSSTHIVYLSNAKTIMQEEVDTRLTVNQGSKDTVVVNKGKVEVVSQQGMETLSSQQRADIVDNKIKMVELPSAPRLRFPVSTDQILMQRDRNNKVEFTWNPVQ
ncbi:MAG: FecR domain-containing protein, partial [Blastocatellia bacterium]|nr:FecR domain-containing protein [Blastocatellia bacterium]